MGRVATLSQGQCFGERAILTAEPRNATISADGGPVTCLTLSRVDFNRILGQLQDLMDLASERKNDLAGNARIKYVGKYQSCMVSKLRTWQATALRSRCGMTTAWGAPSTRWMARPYPRSSSQPSG